MKNVEKYVVALNKAISFIDMFGENFGEPRLSDCIQIATDGKKITITNRFGTTKTFTFGGAHMGQILDEVAANIESFKTNYRGFAMVHNGAHSGKIISTFTSKIILDDGIRASRQRVAVLTLKGREVYNRYEITETFGEDF